MLWDIHMLIRLSRLVQARKADAQAVTTSGSEKYPYVPGGGKSAFLGLIRS